MASEDHNNNKRNTFKNLTPPWFQHLHDDEFLHSRCLTQRKWLSRSHKGLINICIVGPTGAGKSSFVNTLLTASSGSWTSKPRIDAPAYDLSTGDCVESDHVTRIFKRYTLNYQTCLIDTIGMKTEENGKLTYDGLWRHLLEGHFRQGTPLEDLMNAQEEKSYEPGELDVEEMNHVVIVVRAMNEGQSDDVFKHVIRAMLEMDVPIPIIGVVTKVDGVSNVGEMFDNAEVMKEYMKAGKATKTQRTFPVQCYTNVERCRNHVTDLLALDVLQEALDLGNEYKQKMTELSVLSSRNSSILPGRTSRR